MAIYQAALGKGYEEGVSVAYEKPYPSVSGKNPPRADLAFKDPGRGQKWAYVEAKHYRLAGKSNVDADIRKLQKIQQRSQRWMFVYRVRRTDAHASELVDLLSRSSDL